MRYQQIRAAYRRVCAERGHAMVDVILNESMPSTDGALREDLALTGWLADKAALDAAQGNRLHVIFALTEED